jgi:hypothetical protein
VSIATIAPSAHLHPRAVPVPPLLDDPRPFASLATARLRQAWLDLADWRPRVRRAAVAWCQDTEGVRAWCHLAQVDENTVLRHIQAALQTLDTQPAQLALFAEGR